MIIESCQVFAMSNQAADIELGLVWNNSYYLAVLKRRAILHKTTIASDACCETVCAKSVDHSGALRKEWLLYLKLRGSLSDTGFILDTWWELTCLQSVSNYDVILDRAHILFLSGEKNAVGKIARHKAVPSSAGTSTFYSQEQRQ